MILARHFSKEAKAFDAQSTRRKWKISALLLIFQCLVIGDLAQLVERHLEAVGVRGSIPRVAIAEQLKNQLERMNFLSKTTTCSAI